MVAQNMFRATTNYINIHVLRLDIFCAQLAHMCVGTTSRQSMWSARRVCSKKKAVVSLAFVVDFLFFVIAADNFNRIEQFDCH